LNNTLVGVSPTSAARLLIAIRHRA
jgi:hypothetical protein